MDIFCAYRGTFLASMTRYTKLDGRRSVAYGPSDMDHEDVTTEKPREVCGPQDMPDPKALLKRAKLLRLKAKKAKSEAGRDKFLAQAKDVERQIPLANGARGVLGRRNGRERQLRGPKSNLGMLTQLTTRPRPTICVSTHETCRRAQKQHSVFCVS